MRMFLGSLVVLAPMAGLAAVLSWPGLPLTAFTGQLENLYGFLAVFGLISTAVLGMLFKILPFLVWYGTYSRHIGRVRVPTFADMYSDRLICGGGTAHIVAVVVITVGILLSDASVVRWGGVVFAVSTILHGSNFARVLGHIRRPQMLPAVVHGRTQKYTRSS